MRILLTCSDGVLAGLEGALAAGGHQVDRRPLVRTEPLMTGAARSAGRALLDCPWLLFASQAAVRAWLRLNLPLANLAAHLGAVGRATAAGLESGGGSVALVASTATAAGLADSFMRHPLAAAPVGLPRGDQARPDLPALLERSGFQVKEAVIYRTLTEPYPELSADLVLVASPSAVRALPPRIRDGCTLLALGPTTAEAARAAGWPCVQAPTPDVEGVLSLIEELSRDR